jgi:hypothetical protein
MGVGGMGYGIRCDDPSRILFLATVFGAGIAWAILGVHPDTRASERQPGWWWLSFGAILLIVCVIEPILIHLFASQPARPGEILHLLFGASNLEHPSRKVSKIIREIQSEYVAIQEQGTWGRSEWSRRMPELINSLTGKIGPLRATFPLFYWMFLSGLRAGNIHIVCSMLLFGTIAGLMSHVGDRARKEPPRILHSLWIGWIVSLGVYLVVAVFQSVSRRRWAHTDVHPSMAWNFRKAATS